MNFEIREARATDRLHIREVVAAAFGSNTEADLVDQIYADGDDVVSLVALAGTRIVGHVLFSPMSGSLRALGLAPVSVSPPYQRQGVGSALIREGLNRARAEGWQAVFVLGSPDYYQRFGFDPRLASGFTSPYAGPYLMALALVEPLPVSSGRIDYAPAFGALG